MVKEAYTKPEVEIEVFEVVDVLTASGESSIPEETRRWELPEIE